LAPAVTFSFAVAVLCGGTTMLAVAGEIVTPDGAVICTLTRCGWAVALSAPTVSVPDPPGATSVVWFAR